MKFNAEQYWASRKAKVWVVKLIASRGTSETKYVRAKTYEGAIQTAKENSFLKRIVHGRARLATPGDLGCTEQRTA